MTRSDKNPSSRVGAQTRAKVESTLTGDKYKSVKSGGAKSGGTRYEASKSSPFSNKVDRNK